MSKLLDEAMAALKRRADRTGDGKVDMKDVESAFNQAKLRAASFAEQETKKRPLGTIIAVAVIAAAIAYTIARMLPC